MNIKKIKRLFTIILVVALLQLSRLPYMNFNNIQKQESFSSAASIEKVLKEPIKLNSFSQNIAIGATVTGEAIAGFTLGEILVTLTIVGIVASLTLPNLIFNIQQDEYRAVWKKEFSILSQATTNLVMDYGAPWDMTTSTSMISRYQNYLSFVKQDPVATNIFPPQSSYSYYKGGLVGAGWAYFQGTAAAILSDGAMINFESDNNCTAVSGTLSGICGQIIVDVNGAKPPNMEGVDMFYIWVVKDSGGNYVLKPRGTPNDGNTCVAGSSGSGTSTGCSSLALGTTTMP